MGILNDIEKMNMVYNAFLCEGIYEPETALIDLKTNGYVEICIITEGNGIHAVLDQAIPCKAGDVFVTPPNIPHRYFVENSGETLRVRQLRFYMDEWFDKELSDPESARYCYGLFNDGSITAYAMLNGSMRERIEMLYDTIEWELAEKKSEWNDVVKACIVQLFINIARYIDSSIRNSSSFSAKKWNTALVAVQYVKKSYNDPTLTLESIAEKLYVSKSYLSKLFRSLIGKSFSEYLRETRIKHSCEMLKKGELTIDEIVRECGLRDTATFYKNFFWYMKMTPSEYRQNMRPIGMDSVSAEDKEIVQKRMKTFREIAENIEKGRAKPVTELVQKAIDEGADPAEILKEGLLAGMSVVGERFKNNEIYVPEVLIAARAMNMGAQVLKPFLAESGVTAAGRVCIGTVQGDLHDIGKNLVKMMMEGKGLEVIDLGVDVPPQAFIQTAIEKQCSIICCSALLTTTMGVMGDVVQAAEAAGIRDKVKIMVGGAPVSASFCQQIGADLYTPDATSAADAAVAFCKELP